MLISSIFILGVISMMWLAHRVVKNHHQSRKTETWLFFFFAVLAGLWGVSSVLELWNPGISSSIIFAKMQYISITFLPAVWLIFLLHYTDTASRFHKWIYIFFIPSALNLLMVWSNEWHSLVWTSFEYSTKPFPHTNFNRGLWFEAVIVPYAYMLLILSTAVLVRAFWVSTRTQRKQLYILLGVQLVPIIFNALYLLRILPFDVTPLGFSLSSLLLGIGLFRQQLMQQLPVAYHRVFSQMRDGVIVLDKNRKLLDFNQAAQHFLNLSSRSFQQSIDVLCPFLPPVAEKLWQEKYLEFGHGSIKMALTVTELTMQDNCQGYILTVQDISERMTQQERLERQARELELLDRVRTVVASQLNLSEVMQHTVKAVAEVFGYKLVSVYLHQQDELVLQYQVGYPKVIERVPVSKGVIGKVLRSGQPALITSTKENQDFLEAFEGICSEVAVPLVSQGKVTGVLNLESTEHVLGPEDLRVMMSLSEHIGMAIERAKLYDAISHNEKQLRLLTENMNDLICLHNLDGTFSYVSPSSRTLLGYEPSELLGTSPLVLVHPEDLESLKQRLTEFPQEHISKPLIHRCRHKSGEYIWLEVFPQPIFEKGVLTGIVASSRDITERKRMEEQMLEGALLYDALTGLPNRVLFMDRLQQAFHRRYQVNEDFAIMFLDLDRFKFINDSLGHRMGDLLLIEVAQRLQGCVRAQDTVSRLGGDEFAVLVEGITHEELTLLAERIQQALQHPVRVEAHEMNTSASIGIIVGAHVADPETLLRHADMAMYQAKNSGKAKYMFFDEAMHTRLRETMKLEVDLLKALERKELNVYYQPIMSIEPKTLAGFEALVRWQHPEQGLLLPGLFIPIAEEMGLISNIDLWVLQQACKQLGLWQKETLQALRMSVNVSARSLLRTDFLTRLLGFIKESGIQAKQLRLEITESILMDHIATKDILIALRQQGIGLMIDDFGTGYSSLSYLQTLPLDSLKIDRSFMELNDSNKQIVSTIILLAQSLNLDVVAEGIETSKQLEYLKDQCCSFGQGHLFSKPMSATDIEQRFFLTPQIA